jgi:hypothetical protein
VIPKKFCLMGHTITVKVVPEKEWADDETVGFWNSQNLTISVLGGLDDQRTQQIFCHELVHAILHCMAENDLNDNEKFVDVFGSLLHQAWGSIK